MRRAAVLTAFVVLTVATATATARAAGAPTAAETVAAARALGVGDDAAALQERFLPGARLLPTGGRARLGGSRIGGSPDLPRGTAWPSCHGGHRLTLLAQVDLRELTRAVPGATRARGTLAVFASQVVDPTAGYPEIDPWSGWLAPGACFQARYWPRSAALVHRATPRGVTAFALTPVRLRPTLTVPDWLLVKGWLGHIPGDGWDALAARAAWGDLARPAPYRPLWQVLGWSSPLDRDPTERCVSAHQPQGPKRLLLQLDADEDSIDFDDTAGGQLLITIPAADLRGGRFDRLCGEYQND